MFRRPREASTETALKPSTGRPPTPPGSTSSVSEFIPNPTPSTTSRMIASPNTKPLTPRTSSKSNLPVLGRQGTKKVATAPASAKKSTGKPNQSILSFFKKVDGPALGEDSIFVGQEDLISLRVINDEGLYEFNEDQGSRYNEDGCSNKRRKLDRKESQAPNSQQFEEHRICEAEDNLDVRPAVTNDEKTIPRKIKKIGPFLEDSDDEELTCLPHETPKIPMAERHESQGQINNICVAEPGVKSQLFSQHIVPPIDPSDALEFKPRENVPIEGSETLLQTSKCTSIGSSTSPPKGTEQAPVLAADGQNYDSRSELNPAHPVPELKKESTSIDTWDGFDDLEEFPDEFADDGEEFMERKWMQEQAMLEGVDPCEQDGLQVVEPGINEEATAACPICNSSLDGITSNEATRHVNGCLDGKPVLLATSGAQVVEMESSKPQMMPAGASKRFSRKAAQPRPGQASPFELGANLGPSSAFSKLMSGHAEDAAWATAAAAEHAARGKPAYQRTCPFYKIMPGFFICVDAFRYGAVQGCHAYFLSHFHSDHYVGLSSTWCHGPIYCSRVTANLVKQQLRVDQKYVIPLDFEAKVEVPGTEGVFVTMIPANHCPGSSLYLFEKTISRGRNLKVQRVLHCGDFRACPAHIEHPLLMPDIVESVSGRTKQQKIDVCYLDTTYLNPRYAFPSQEDVISACADMCVSLRKDQVESSDAWEVAKKERAGTGMNHYVSRTAIKIEEIQESSGKSTGRGRLLIICGTYSIGKERICMGIARALDCKIYAPPSKMRICAALEDPELMSRMTPHPLEAQIHMQALMEIRPETLGPYLDSYRPHFSRIVAFRPSGWNYKPPIGRGIEAPSIETILKGKNWKSTFGFADLQPQRGSTREVKCFGVPYSEHSSFRELTLFVCALRIEKVIPTVNVGSARGRAAMRGWVDRWMTERRKAENGVVKIGSEEDEVKW